MTGSFLVAVYEILPLVAPDTKVKTYPWNHLPPWVVWTLAMLALIVAQYLAWRDMRNQREDLLLEVERLRNERPRLSACLNDKRSTLLLRVRNEGAVAKVSARVTVVGDTSRRVSNVTAAWKDEAGEEVEIKTGDSKQIVISETWSGDSSIISYWCVPFIVNGKLESAGARSGDIPSFPSYDSSEDDDAAIIRQRVRISVFSKPAALSPPIQCEITLVGCDRWENLSGVSHCPEPALIDPSEEWQDFERAASAIAVHSNLLEELGHQSRDEEWQHLRHVARNALTLSESLQEPYREQARTVVSPFIDIKQAAFDSLSGAAAALQEWLTDTNRYILKQRWASPPPVKDPPSSTPSE